MRTLVLAAFGPSVWPADPLVGCEVGTVAPASGIRGVTSPGLDDGMDTGTDTGIIKKPSSRSISSSVIGRPNATFASAIWYFPSVPSDGEPLVYANTFS